ncbi:monofunctional biosynthetic peptidoglycan transglycosylase [Sphingomonas sabuli]|uniref:Biosynthetic peptidoglycan transglycosylase n=1 Tax=Sphingomonas sabuli TaxID=2764186 RepID=A0A7G9L3N1_9SPHN|nr:monofunctional biosynthetic peptidoglycan transglycosylase [Sphingomonas sabuli]
MAKRSTNTIPTYKRKRASRRGPVARVLLLPIKLVLGLILFSLLWVLAYRFINPPLTATMAGDFIGGRKVTRDWMPLGQIDRDMVRAVIAAEDGKFCAHNGFDLDAIQEAARRNASGGRIRGGSTISQQTAKNAFLWQGGGYFRKGLEAWFTLLMEQMYPKRRIMELYLNLAETGIGTYGVNAGSQRYFGHDASAMDRTEAARIAAVLPLPKERGAIAPQGFTRRYGNTISARIGVVGRDGLDACVYDDIAAPKDKAPPRVSKAPRPLPGGEYETATPPPPPAVTQDTSEPETPPETSSYNVVLDQALPPENTIAPLAAPEPAPGNTL